MVKKENIVSPQISILSALKLMDEIKRKLLFVVEKQKKFVGVLSLGDIQRAIINKKSLTSPIKGILRKEITVAGISQSFSEIKLVMLEKRVEAMPVIDDKGQLVKIIYWEDIVDEGWIKSRTQLNTPVVIMAGGQGSRLKPLTNVIPKPLMPIGDNSIIEEIMDRFVQYGCNRFFITLNYRADIIKYYLQKETKKKYSISFLQEKKALGTAGSLHLLKNVLKETFFVSNCDILIDDDYAEIMNYHRKNKNELTVVAAIKSYSIPYGTIETNKSGILESITEKPEITFKINTGFYILEPGLIKDIPTNKIFHITDLIEKLQSQKRRVGVFPVSENSWKDIGEWKDYLKLIHP